MLAVRGLCAGQVNERQSKHVQCSNLPKKRSERCKVDNQPFISRSKDTVGFVSIDIMLAVSVDCFGDGGQSWR